MIKIFYDVETTGTNPKLHSIHQLDMKDLHFLFAVQPVGPECPFMFVIFTDEKNNHSIKIGLN